MNFSFDLTVSMANKLYDQLLYASVVNVDDNAANTEVTDWTLHVVAVFGGMMEIREGSLDIIRGMDAGYVEHVLKTDPDSLSLQRGGNFFKTAFNFARPLLKRGARELIKFAGNKLGDLVGSGYGQKPYYGSGMVIGSGLKVLN